MKFWKDWDESEKKAAIRIAGLCFAAFAIFAAIASISYLFHWKEDMSLLGLAGDTGGQEAGKAGSLGLRFAHFFICDLLGLGSFALLVIPAALAARLVMDRWHRSLIKTTIVASTGALTASVALSSAGALVGLGNAFGGGLGGKCGAFISEWSVSRFGQIVTGIFIAILILCWLFFSSRRFTVWFSGLWEKKAPGQAGIDPVAAEEPAEPEPVVVETCEENVEEVIEEEPGDEPETESGKMPEEKPESDSNLEIIYGEKLETTVKEPLKPIDNRLDPPDGLPRYKFPQLTLLQTYSESRNLVPTEELTCNTNKIRAALRNYNVEVDDVKAIVGPTVTLYKVYPAPGVQIAQIKRLQDDIAMNLNADGVRVMTLSDSVGIEVANKISSLVPLRALLNNASFRESKAELPVAIGQSIANSVKVFDLADAPHLLVAGATKQGKSVGLNIIINSLLFVKHPSELKFVFIDPKMVEFSAYAKLLKHYLAVLPDAGDEEDEKRRAIVKKPKDAEKILRSLCTEMDERYELLSLAGVNKITAYNEKYKQRHLLPKDGHRYLPYLVCVVDEYADLTMTVGASPETKAASKSITNSVIRLAQKGRAAGIHVILATQRPSVDVISGIIKSNFPMRIAFRVSSRTDSQTILDAPGAEKLIGRGDMLLYAGIETDRVQCGYISTEEIEAVTGFIGAQNGFEKSYNTPYYLPDAGDAGAEGGGLTDMGDIDERFTDAAQLVVTTQKASTSYLQTRLGMGFAKAARVMGQLEAAGIVGPQEGAKPRQVLIPDLNSLQPILDSFVK